MTIRTKIAALAVISLATPALAQDRTASEQAVVDDVELFFAAQNAGDKAEMRDGMVPAAILTIQRTGSVKGPREEVISTKRYIKRIMTYKDRTEERMAYATVEVNGDTALAEGPFTFTVDGLVTHCGINSLGMVRRDGRWLVGDSNYKIVPPSECAAIGAPKMSD